MKVIFYKIFYNAAVSFIVRNVLKSVNIVFGTTIFISVSGKLNLKSPLGKPIVIETNETCFVGSYIFWKGIAEYEYCTIFCKLIQSSNTFFDVGSNVGLFTALAGVHNRNIQIEAFDPTLSSCIYTNKNIVNNHIKNARVHQVALSEKSETLIFHEVLRTKYLHVKHHLSGASSLISDFITPGNSYEVKAISLDNFVNDHAIEQIDIIKIDAERAEAMILRGGLASIEKFKPIIFCEVRPDMLELINSLVETIDYVSFHFKNKQFQQIDAKSLLEYDAEHDFMLVHRSKLDLVHDYIS